MILISVSSYKCLTVTLYDYAHFFVTVFKNTVFASVCKPVGLQILAAVTKLSKVKTFKILCDSNAIKTLTLN